MKRKACEDRDAEQDGAIMATANPLPKPREWLPLRLLPRTESMAAVIKVIQNVFPKEAGHLSLSDARKKPESLPEIRVRGV